MSNTAMGGSNLRRQWSVRSESHHPLAHPQGRHVNLHTPTTTSGKTHAHHRQTRKKENTIFNIKDLTKNNGKKEIPHLTTNRVLKFTFKQLK
jgi:hypothetical protein